MQVTYIDLIVNYWFSDVTKVNKPIKLLGIFFTYGKHKIENSTLIWHLQMSLTIQSNFPYLYNISTILEWKNISSTACKVWVITSNVGIVPWNVD